MCLSVTTDWALAGLVFTLLHVLLMSVVRAWTVLVFAFIGFGFAYYVRCRFGGWRQKAFARVAMGMG